MRRVVSLMLAAVLIAGVTALPAGAKIDKNPNVEMLTDVTCENGLEFGAIWSPTEQSVTGHDLATNTTGVAKSIYAVVIVDGAIVPVFEIFDRPGKGLDNITVWCYWPDAGSPTGWIGGEILFNAKLRP